METSTGFTRGLKRIGTLVMRAVENTAQRLAVLAALGTLAGPLILANGNSPRMAVAAGFGAAILSLAVGTMLWMMSGRAVRRREGRGLVIFSLCLLLISGVLMADRRLRTQIALIGNAVFPSILNPNG